jgi:hypothetical protein
MHPWRLSDDVWTRTTPGHPYCMGQRATDARACRRSVSFECRRSVSYIRRAVRHVRVVEMGGRYRLVCTLDGLLNKPGSLMVWDLEEAPLAGMRAANKHG